MTFLQFINVTVIDGFWQSMGTLLIIFLLLRDVFRDSARAFIMTFLLFFIWIGWVWMAIVLKGVQIFYGQEKIYTIFLWSLIALYVISGKKRSGILLFIGLILLAILKLIGVI